MAGCGGIRRTIGAAAGASVSLVLLVVPGPSARADAPCTGVPAVTVDGGAWTRRSLVTLRVTAPPGAAAVEIANSADFSDAQVRPLSASCTYGWRLAAGPGGPERDVHVRFPGAARPTEVASTRVWLDAEEPVIVRADARWRHRRHGWVLHVRAIDLGSGAAWFQTARRDGTARRRYADRRTVVTPDRSIVERVRSFDRLGNHTGWVRVRFLR